jgi:hypothetical protein
VFVYRLVHYWGSITLSVVSVLLLLLLLISLKDDGSGGRFRCNIL